MLDQYNQYAKSGLIKFRNQWIAPDARDAILLQGETQAKLALTLYRSGKLKDALEAAKDALKTDDENHTALALAALAHHWQRGPTNGLKASEYFQKSCRILIPAMCYR